ncbi:MAG: hypothetical protein H8D45_06915, partial [Bacteroidetes bacterium]|nr:hypothetical protein [Bacteroidota bacterium]
MRLRYGLYDHVHSYPSIIERHTKDIIEKSPYTIYQGKNDCYHLPHGEYSHRFVSLYPIFNDPKLLNRLSHYLLTLLFLKGNIKDVDIVIGGTYSAQPLIHSIAKQLDAEFIVIDRYVDHIEDPHISALVQGKHAIIVTDVVSSGSFVESIENRLIHEKAIIESLGCICDLRSEKSIKLGPSQKPLISLLQLPTEKSNHPDRENIWEVNPISHRLSKLDEIRSKDTVPSIIETNKELIEWVNQSKSLIPSHITLGPTHYTYFIDTEQLLKKFSEKIFNLVLNDINDFFDKNSQFKPSDLSFLITPKGSNAELYFPDIIRKTLPQLEWLKLDRVRFSSQGFWRVDGLDEKLDSTKRLQNSIVLIWDDGTNTGRTLMQMLKIIADCKPKLILAYCLVNRMPPYISLLLNSITELLEYSKVIIRFISNIPVGTYTLSNCPICNLPEPKVPPIRDILNFWSKENESNDIREWNHLSKKKIIEDSRMSLRERGIDNVDIFISKIFKIRCEIGNFELYTNISQTEREVLYLFIKDDEMLAALCYIFNREPSLLASIIKFQMKDFKKDLLNAVIKKICHRSSKNMEGNQDITHFVANYGPDLVIDHLEPFLGNMLNTEKSCVCFLSIGIAYKRMRSIIQFLDRLVDRLNNVPYLSNQSNYLLGLSKACLLWAKSEEEKERADTLHNTLSDLQVFYSSDHSGSVEFGAPLHDIVSSIVLIDQGNYDKEYITTIYRNWREFTVYMTNMRIIPSIKTLEHILEQEIPPGTRKYYVSTRNGFLRDYYEIERVLTVIKEISNPKLIGKEDIISLRKAVQRFYDYLFKKDNYLANTVSKVPAFIVRKIDEHLVTQKEWLCKAGIQLNWEPDRKSGEINGLITSRTFKRVLREIFVNIQKHNFRIDVGKNVVKNAYEGHSIDINIKTTDKRVSILIGCGSFRTTLVSSFWRMVS